MRKPVLDDYMEIVPTVKDKYIFNYKKYITALQTYCDELEQRCLSDEWNLTCLDKDYTILEKRIEPLEKALDKACEMLVQMKLSSDCWEFNECPFRQKCNENNNGGCSYSHKWKEWCLKDE